MSTAPTLPATSPRPDEVPYVPALAPSTAVPTPDEVTDAQAAGFVEMQSAVTYEPGAYPPARRPMLPATGQDLLLAAVAAHEAGESEDFARDLRAVRHAQGRDAQGRRIPPPPPVRIGQTFGTDAMTLAEARADAIGVAGARGLARRAAFAGESHRSIARLMTERTSVLNG